MGLAEGQGGFSHLETQVGVSEEQQSCFREEKQGFLSFPLFIYQPLYRRQLHK